MASQDLAIRDYVSTSLASNDHHALFKKIQQVRATPKDDTLFDIDTDALDQFVTYFVDSEEESASRRWVGILLLEFFVASESSRNHIRSVPAHVKHAIGKVVLSLASEDIKIIAGSIIRTLHSHKFRLEEFWTDDVAQQATGCFSQIPDTQWVDEFDIFLDQLSLTGKMDDSDSDASWATHLEIDGKQILNNPGCLRVDVQVDSITCIQLPLARGPLFVDIPMSSIKQTKVSIDREMTRDDNEVMSIPRLELVIDANIGSPTPVMECKINGKGVSISSVCLVFKTLDDAKTCSTFIRGQMTTPPVEMRTGQFIALSSLPPRTPDANNSKKIRDRLKDGSGEEVSNHPQVKSPEASKADLSRKKQSNIKVTSSEPKVAASKNAKTKSSSTTVKKSIGPAQKSSSAKAGMVDKRGKGVNTAKATVTTTKKRTVNERNELEQARAVTKSHAAVEEYDVPESPDTTSSPAKSSTQKHGKSLKMVTGRKSHKVVDDADDDYDPGGNNTKKKNEPRRSARFSTTVRKQNAVNREADESAGPNDASDSDIEEVDQEVGTLSKQSDNDNIPGPSGPLPATSHIDISPEASNQGPQERIHEETADVDGHILPAQTTITTGMFHRTTPPNDLLFDEVIRKTPIVEFHETGPKNQGIVPKDTQFRLRQPQDDLPRRDDDDLDDQAVLGQHFNFINDDESLYSNGNIPDEQQDHSLETTALVVMNDPVSTPDQGQPNIPARTYKTIKTPPNEVPVRSDAAVNTSNSGSAASEDVPGAPLTTVEPNVSVAVLPRDFNIALIATAPPYVPQRSQRSSNNLESLQEPSTMRVSQIETHIEQIEHIVHSLPNERTSQLRHITHHSETQNISNASVDAIEMQKEHDIGVTRTAGSREPQLAGRAVQIVPAMQSSAPIQLAHQESTNRMTEVTDPQRQQRRVTQRYEQLQSRAAFPAAQEVFIQGTEVTNAPAHQYQGTLRHDHVPTRTTLSAHQDVIIQETKITDPQRHQRRVTQRHNQVSTRTRLPPFDMEVTVVSRSQEEHDYQLPKPSKSGKEHVRATNHKKEPRPDTPKRMASEPPSHSPPSKHLKRHYSENDDRGEAFGCGVSSPQHVSSMQRTGSQLSSRVDGDGSPFPPGEVLPLDSESGSVRERGQWRPLVPKETPVEPEGASTLQGRRGVSGMNTPPANVAETLTERSGVIDAHGLRRDPQTSSASTLIVPRIVQKRPTANMERSARPRTKDETAKTTEEVTRSVVVVKALEEIVPSAETTVDIAEVEAVISGRTAFRRLIGTDTRAQIREHENSWDNAEDTLVDEPGNSAGGMLTDGRDRRMPYEQENDGETDHGMYSDSGVSAQSVEDDRELEPEDLDDVAEQEDMDWEESLQPHQQNLAQAVVRISRRLLRHIVETETALQSIVSDYQINGLDRVKMLHKICVEDHEKIMAKLAQGTKSVTTELKSVAGGLTKDKNEIRTIVKKAELSTKAGAPAHAQVMAQLKNLADLYR